MTVSRLNSLLEDLGRSVGLAGLGADGKGYCRLEFDERTVVHMREKPNSDRLAMYSEVTDIGEDHFGPVCPLLLNWNLKPQKTCGGTLGLSSKTVVLSCEINLKSIDSSAFQFFLDEFVDNVEQLRESIREKITALEMERAKEGIIPDNPFLLGVRV